MGSSSDLDNLAQRTASHAEERFHANNALVADDAGFRRLAIGHYDDQGYQAFVKKVNISGFPVAFVQDAMVRQAREFKTMPNRPKLTIAKREQNAVIDCFSFRARTFSRPKVVVRIGNEMSDHVMR